MRDRSDQWKTKDELIIELDSLRARLSSTNVAPPPDRTPDEAHAGDRYRAIAENARDLIAEIDASGRILFVSAESDTLLGRSPKQLVGRNILEAGPSRSIHADDRAILEAVFARGVPPDGRTEIEFRVRHADGRWVWLHSKAQIFGDDDGARRAVVVTRDVTERVEAQRALRESEERYRLVAQASQDMITELDAEGRLLYSSPTVEEVLGYDPDAMIGTTPLSLVHPEDVDRLMGTCATVVERGGAERGDPYRVRHRDGSWRWLEGGGLSYRRDDGEVRFLSITRDVTEARRAEEERRELETRVQRAQKLESLGILAGGIAHDFNNLLTPILGDAGLALMDLATDSRARARLLRIQKAARRAASLTHQMLAYAGSGPLVLDSIDLSALVEEMAQLLTSAASGQAAFEFDLCRDLPRIVGDAAQLSQVVVNLITNASEAVEGRGRITLRTGTLDATQIRPNPSVPNPGLSKGLYAYFEVVDTGCGMSPETQAKIFDPFFTTKFTGRGLGLAAVLGIVRAHEGAIEIESEPAQGTRFCVLFPETATVVAAPDPPVPRDNANWRGRGTVLIVDDDEGVRELTAETLQRAGLSVLLAADGERGIAVFRANTDAIDLVLLDRTMPCTGGEEAFAAMRQIRPDAQIVLVSGYSEERAFEHFEGRGLAGFLQKPFLPETLIERVRSVLDGDRSGR